MVFTWDFMTDLEKMSLKHMKLSIMAVLSHDSKNFDICSGHFRVFNLGQNLGRQVLDSPQLRTNK